MSWIYTELTFIFFNNRIEDKILYKFIFINHRAYYCESSMKMALSPSLKRITLCIFGLFFNKSTFRNLLKYEKQTNGKMNEKFHENECNFSCIFVMLFMMRSNIFLVQKAWNARKIRVYEFINVLYIASVLKEAIFILISIGQFLTNIFFHSFNRYLINIFDFICI